MRQHFIIVASLSVLSILVACSRENFPVATPDNCTPVNLLRVNRDSRAVIDAALATRIDYRRRKYDSKEFCAFNVSTGNGKYYLLTIYDEVGGNHRSETYIILNNKKAINTELNIFDMATDDSLKTNEKITSSVNRLKDLDNSSRQELILMLSKRARRARM